MKTLAIILTLTLPVLAQPRPVTQPPAGTPRVTPTIGVAPGTVQRKAGTYRTVSERVWVPSVTERVWVNPVYTTAFDRDGTPVQVLVEAGHYRSVTLPGRWETRERKVLVSTPAPITNTFTLHNRRQFPVQLHSITVHLPNQRHALITLPRDRVISSTSKLTIDLPPEALAITTDFKTWDHDNKRFQHPIFSAHYPLASGPHGSIH